MNYPTELVFSAVCAAQRINNAYIKVSWPDSSPDGQRLTNRAIMLSALSGGTNIITDEDIELGKKVRQHYRGLTFKLIQGINLSDFEKTALVIAELEEISSNYHLAVACSLPGCYLRNLTRSEVNTRVQFAHGGYIGTAKSKVILNVEVLRVVYSQQWETYYVTAITDQDQAIFYAFKSSPEVGSKLKITGTIKAHRDNQTQLSRVKEI